MSDKIVVILNGSTKFSTRGMTISKIINGERPCGGHGRCGKCRVIASGALSPLSDEERKMLSEDEIKKGVRLACITYAMGDCEITTLEQRPAQIVTDGGVVDYAISPTFLDYGIAIDIGTTTLAARLYNAKGELLATTACLNPQRKWGADVISRVEAALDGDATELAKAIRMALDTIITTLAEIAKIDPKEVERVVVTGNTVMLSLLTEQSVEPFSHAPFKAERLFGESLTAGELELCSLSPDTEVYLPLAISAFVGADTTCAILATRLYEKERALLIDIGTNGEIALWKNATLSVCSTAAGPAFEGVGISMGMRGGIGAIDRVFIDSGRIRSHVIGDVAPTGICGSGLVDAIACMLEKEIIDESGYLENDEYIISSPVSVTPKDIRMLQLAKSAICAGAMTLIKEEGLVPSEISTLYIAGGFGKYLSMENAAKIGLLPKELAEKAEVVGNAALTGAAMLLLNKETESIQRKIANGARVLDLSVSPTFSDLYMLGMTFPEGE